MDAAHNRSLASPEQTGSVDAVLREQYDGGVASYPQVPLSREAHSEDVLGRTRAWCTETREATADALRRLHGLDLFLAIACDRSASEAWGTLRRQFAMRLTSLGMQRGMVRATAEDHVDDLFSDMALPPKRGHGRTRLWAYTGRGSLFSYLATLLLRRRADVARQRQRRRAHAAPVEIAAAGIAQAGSDPLHALLGREAARHIHDAVGEALAACTPREHLVLVLKYGDGLGQKQIARLIGVGAPRVSRLAARATERVRVAVLASLPSAGSEGDGSSVDWTELGRRVRAEMAIRSGLLRPASEPAKEVSTDA